MLANPGLFLHDSEFLCCNMSGRDCVFVLIWDNSDKKRVFLFVFFLRLLKAEREKTKKQTEKTNLQSRAIFSSVSRLFCQMREEGHRNLCMCCFPGYCCCCRAVAHLWSCPLWTLSAVLWGLAMPPNFPFWRLLSSPRGSWMEKVEWQVWGTHSLLCSTLQRTKGNIAWNWEDGEKE